MSNPKNLNDSEASGILKQELSRVVDRLDKSYTTYPVLLGVVDILSAACSLMVNEGKARDYLCYAADKLETMVREDKFFGLCSGAFQPLSATLTLLRAAEQAGMPDLAAKAQWVLEHSDPAQYPVLPGRALVPVRSGPPCCTLFEPEVAQSVVSGEIPLLVGESTDRGSAGFGRDPRGSFRRHPFSGAGPRLCRSRHGTAHVVRILFCGLDRNVDV